MSCRFYVNVLSKLIFIYPHLHGIAKRITPVYEYPKRIGERFLVYQIFITLAFYRFSMTIYLLDDDEIQLIYLTSILGKNPSYRLAGQQTDSMLAIKDIETLKPDVLFLDIELKQQNGIDLYKSLTYKPLLILCTSHLEFAVEAFDLNAIDYLVKPVSPERIYTAMEKVNAVLQFKQQSSTRELRYERDSIFVKEGTSYRNVLMQQILYIEALGDFAEFHIHEQAKIVALINLKTLEQQLPSAVFLRISRMHIININHIESFNSQEIIIRGKELSIGKTYTDTVIQTLLSSQLVVKRNR